MESGAAHANSSRTSPLRAGHQEALEAGRFTKATFDGADVGVSAGVGINAPRLPRSMRINVVQPRTGRSDRVKPS
jgi:hypothetical protein